MRQRQGEIRAFLTRLTKDPALADDLAQTAFMKAYHNQGALRDPKAARAWIYQIAYRCFVDEARKNKRRRDMAVMIVPESDSLEHGPTPSGGIAVDVARAMNSLAPECRAVVMLALGQGFSHGEVADMTGLPLGTVKSHIARGKVKLQTFLSAYETAI
jgi:RNA polymerase sigma-70 factor (ECF subfamily)